MNTLRVLHIFPRLEFGGAERLVLEYAQKIDRSRIELAVATTVSGSAMLPLFETAGIKLCVGVGSRTTNARALIRFVNEFKPDIIHTHLLGGDIFGWYLKVIKKVPIRWVSTLHSVESSTSLIRRVFWKSILKKADTVIAVADKVRLYALSSFGLKAEQIRVIANGIDYQRLSALAAPDFSKPRQFGIIGRLETEKGHAMLLKALAAVRSADWTLNIFGAGSRQAELVAVSEQLGIADRLRWHGMVIDQVAMYEDIDTVIQPSAREGLSLAVIEAMAAGRLVIVSSAAAEETIEDKKTGLVADGVEEIVRAIRFSYEQPAAVAKLAAAARMQARTFDIAQHLATLEALYAEIAVR